MKQIIIFGLAVSLLFCACGRDDTSAEPSPSLTAEQIIERCSEEVAALQSFHFELDQEGGGTPIAMGLEMDAASGDMLKPDKLNIEVSAGFIQVELITVGDITYMTNPLNGNWEPLPNNLTAVRLFDPNIGIKVVVSGITNATVLGEEKVGGALCYYVRGVIDSGELSAISCGAAIEGITIDTDIWISKKDFLPRKFRFEGQITKNEEIGIVRILTVSEFNEPVTIELPE
ncbi:MAG: LppX_LprAFG lipoprotein [Chloroflexota bacterium]|nr:LppX_LprAFG lipoprotein [Chloroflexota bacterium]